MHADKAWITNYAFRTLLERVFIPFTSTTAMNRSLLLVDGHVSRYNYETLTFCRAAGIDMLVYPPHATPFMQVLDRCFGSIKAMGKEAYFDSSVSAVGHTVDRGAVIRVLSETTMAALPPTVIAAAWAACGQWPPSVAALDSPQFISGMRQDDTTARPHGHVVIDDNKQSQLYHILNQRWCNTVMTSTANTLTAAYASDPRLVSVLPIPQQLDPKKKNKKKKSNRMPYYPRLLSSDEIIAEVQARKNVVVRAKKRIRNEPAAAVDIASIPAVQASVPVVADHVAAAAAAVAVAVASASAVASEVVDAGPAPKRRMVTRVRTSIDDGDSSELSIGSSACTTDDDEETEDEDEDAYDAKQPHTRVRRNIGAPPPTYADRLNSSASSSSRSAIGTSTGHDSDSSAHPPPTREELAWLDAQMADEIAAQAARDAHEAAAIAAFASDIDQ